MREVLIQLLTADEGQDLVEYALLVAFIALATAAAFTALQDALAGAFTGIDAADQDLGATTPDP